MFSDAFAIPFRVEIPEAPYLLRFEVISLKFKTSGLWNYLHWE